MNIRPKSLCERMLFTLPHCLTTLSINDLQVAVSQAEDRRREINGERERKEGRAQGAQQERE